MRLVVALLIAVGVSACTKTRPAPFPDPTPAPAARPTAESIKRDVEGAQKRHDDAIDKAFDNAGK